MSIKEAQSGRQPYPPKGTPNPAASESIPLASDMAPVGVIDLSDEIDPLEAIRERIRRGASVKLIERDGAFALIGDDAFALIEVGGVDG